MLIPVRCLSCGKPVAGQWDEYKRRTEAGEDAKRVLDDLGMERICCRRMFIGNFEPIKDIGRFKR